MSTYFPSPVTKGKTENQLQDMLVQNNNLKDEIMAEYKAAQKVIDDAIVVHQEERKKNASADPKTQVISR